MLWAIHCTDRPDTAALRSKHVDAHRDYLKAHGKKIFFSGSMRTDDGELMLGSFFIVKADSREDAKSFVDGEAFNKAGVFEAVRIRRIRKGRFNPGLVDAE